MAKTNQTMIANKYQQARLGGLLKIGKAQVVSVVKLKEEEYYLVVDVVKDVSWLVPVAERMKWKKYLETK